ncbi:hypothetical protein H109_04579 [Trichophyton interdigitale MR816]|uniref:DUF866 domain-containing protein n=1 Tax=Trichophyton interdigitale (strain MR816) TaxID=1215338 RepID=A0A059J6S7_TRIIM|nr:hypothetical protein H109_04579 [Trichophyton interdigitale MR816]
MKNAFDFATYNLSTFLTAAPALVKFHRCLIDSLADRFYRSRMKFPEVEERQTSCGNAGSAGITAGPMAFDESKDVGGKGQKIIEFDCRGLEFTEFKADGKWEAKGTESGTKFSDISLEENEWYDFDEKQGEEVSITEVSWEIRRA